MLTQQSARSIQQEMVLAQAFCTLAHCLLGARCDSSPQQHDRDKAIDTAVRPNEIFSEGALTGLIYVN
jgi:hypothetical protein